MSITLPGLRAAAALPPGARLRCALDLRTVWPSFLVWLAVSVCTLGLGWLVVSGHFFRMIINATRIEDASGAKLASLRCHYDAEADLGRTIRWVALSIVTLGVGLLFYSFHAARQALDATTVIWSAADQDAAERA